MLEGEHVFCGHVSRKAWSPVVALWSIHWFMGGSGLTDGLIQRWIQNLISFREVIGTRRWPFVGVLLWIQFGIYLLVLPLTVLLGTQSSMYSQRSTKNTGNVNHGRVSLQWRR